jgi:uncharacterized protein (TIGR04255 family)
MAEYLKNSPIQEVACEFRFKVNNVLSAENINLFSEEIAILFPIRKKGASTNFEVKIDSSKSELEKKVFEFDQFFSTDEKCFIQLDQERLSIHKIQPYDSWTKLLPYISLAYTSYLKLFNPTEINRLGLRYINRFRIPGKDINLVDHFFIVPGILNPRLPPQMMSFMVGSIFELNDNNDNLKVQLMSELTTPEVTQFMFDLDYSLVKPESIQLSDTGINQWLNLAHTNIEEFFFNSLTSKTIILFK